MKPQEAFATLRLSLLALVVLASPAMAVINVKTPMSLIYQTSRTVIVGTITEVHQAGKTIQVKVQECAKGQSPGPQLEIQAAAAEGLIGRVAVGGPVVLFVAKARGNLATVHLADTWFLATGLPDANPPTWRITGRYDGAQSFPGRTVALVRLVADLKAEKRTMLNVVEQNLFSAPPRKLAKLAVEKPTWLLTADFDGDKQPDLVVGTAKGVRLFLATGAGYRDATAEWGLKATADGCHAVGDVKGEGKLDLLLGSDAWINQGRAFARARLPIAPRFCEGALAAGLVDVAGHGRRDVAVLLASGREVGKWQNPGPQTKWWPEPGLRKLRPAGQPPFAAFFGNWGDTGKPHVMFIENDGITRYALRDDGGPPADLERLCGVDLRKSSEKFRTGLKPIAALALDANGDGLPDLLVMCEAGGLLLVNRGFGAYLLDDKDVGSALVAGPGSKPPFTLGPATPWAAADLDGDGLDDILVLGEDGTLWAIKNRLHKLQ